jgi:HNH endonuclease/NUMOD4 motif/AP2 domain
MGFPIIDDKDNTVLNINDEIWMDIADYEGRYQISNFGNARSLQDNHGNARLQNKVPCKCRKGYLYLQMFVKDVQFRDSLHRLVAKAFIPNPERKRTVNHIDGNKANNHVSNLEWATYSENLLHAHATGLKHGQRHYLGKKVGDTSQYHNVTYDPSRNRWIASVKHNKKSYAKRFPVAVHGAMAQDLAALAVNDLLDQLGITDRPKNVIS